MLSVAGFDIYLGARGASYTMAAAGTASATRRTKKATKLREARERGTTSPRPAVVSMPEVLTRARAGVPSCVRLFVCLYLRVFFAHWHPPLEFNHHNREQ